MLSPSTIKQATFKALEHSCLKARLFYNFLRLSTSYAAGCVNKSKPLGLKLNAHGNKVRQAVDLYCNVHQMHFSNWLALPAVQNKFINHTCPIELIKGSESPRELRRLQTLRRWSHEQEIKPFFTRSAPTRCPYGAGAQRRVLLVVGLH